MAEGGYGDGDQEGFGEPEGVVAEAGCGPRSEDGAEEKAESDQAEIGGFGAALAASLSV